MRILLVIALVLSLFVSGCFWKTTGSVEKIEPEKTIDMPR